MDIAPARPTSPYTSFGRRSSTTPSTTFRHRREITRSAAEQAGNAEAWSVGSGGGRVECQVCIVCGGSGRCGGRGGAGEGKAIDGDGFRGFVCMSGEADF